MKKTFVLDTNVLLHDPDSIISFAEHDVVIPIIVLEELDKHKSDPGEIGHNARHVSRLIDALRNDGDALLSEGIPLGDGHGMLTVYSPNVQFEHKNLFKTNDNAIIGCALKLGETNEGVILVSNDINMRVKADALGVRAQQYKSDKVAAYDTAGIQMVKCDGGVIDKIFADGRLDPSSGVLGELQPRINGCYHFQSHDGRQNALCRFSKGHFRPLRNEGEIFHVRPRNSEQRFLLDVLMDEDIDLVICAGVAGSGKTLLSMAVGLEHVEHGKKFRGHHIDRILITKVIQEVGKDIGYLPGSLEEKMAAWTKPFDDNLEYLLRSDGKAAPTIQMMKDKGKIEVDALTYIRGRSLMNRFVVVDETQNLTPKEIKTLITRIGNSSKLVILGDLQQIDSPYLNKDNNGLAHAMERMAGLENVAVLNLTKTERSSLAALAAARL